MARPPKFNQPELKFHLKLKRAAYFFCRARKKLYKIHRLGLLSPENNLYSFWINAYTEEYWNLDVDDRRCTEEFWVGGSGALYGQYKRGEILLFDSKPKESVLYTLYGIKANFLKFLKMGY